MLNIGEGRIPIETASVRKRRRTDRQETGAGLSKLNLHSRRPGTQELVCSLLPGSFSSPERRYARTVMEPNQIVHSDPEILGGTPVFVGTRVPVDALIDFLEGGDTVEDFLENYPGVSREQVFAFLEEASRALVAKIA